MWVGDDNIFHIVRIAAHNFSNFTDHNRFDLSVLSDIVFCRYLKEFVVESRMAFFLDIRRDVVFVFAMCIGTFSIRVDADIDHIKSSICCELE